MTAPTRPVLRYHGGKWRIAPWIISHFPEHTLYVEPFAGGGSVLMRKPRSDGEVLNDLDESLINVFRVLQNPATAEQLAHAIRFTPYARAEFNLSCVPTAEGVEAARRLIVRSLMGHGGVGSGRKQTGLRPERGIHGVRPARDWSNYPPQILQFCARLNGVCIEQMDAFAVIKKYDSPRALFYVDPPYLHSVRTTQTNGSKQLYPHELSAHDHHRLAELLHQAEGAVVLSGYHSTEYDRLYRGWGRVEKRARADGGADRVEVLWTKGPGSRAFSAGADQPSLELAEGVA